MNKQDIYDLLKEKKIWHEITEHQAVFNMGELFDTENPHPDCIAKNIFIRDDKKTNYYLITVKGDKRINLKDFKKEYGTRHLSFASADDLTKILKITPGSVSPFGLLNDEEVKVQFFIDQEFEKGEGIIGIHPNDNTATVWLKAKDLISLIKEHGNTVTIF